MCLQGKFPLHLRPSLGQMGKQFHAGAVKPEPGFCGSGFGFFQSVRYPIRWTKVTDALGTRLVSISTQSSSAHVEERDQELWGTLEQDLSLIDFSKKQ